MVLAEEKRTISWSKQEADADLQSPALAEADSHRVSRAKDGPGEDDGAHLLVLPGVVESVQCGGDGEVAGSQQWKDG